MKYYKNIQWTSESLVLIFISTAGDGIPPTDARDFHNFIFNGRERFLKDIHYSVLAMGDSNYPYFCRAGIQVENRLKELGCVQIVPIHCVDMEDGNVIKAWTQNVLDVMATLEVTPKSDYLKLEVEEGGFTRNKPFQAKLKIRYNLTNSVYDRDKETIHCEFDLTGSDLRWTAGDALGIYAENNPPEVNKLLRVLKCSGKEVIEVPKSMHISVKNKKLDLYTVLLQCYDLKTVKIDLLQCLYEKNPSKDNQELADILREGLSIHKNQKLNKFIQDHEVADVIAHFHDLYDPNLLLDILASMKVLQPRYYSISSSPKKDPNIACVTAAVVRYQTLGLDRTGVCTTHLQDRMVEGQVCSVFISQNPEFRMPHDDQIPIIMIGPGTGIAPFRAFFQERESWQSKGLINLRVAFSREQKTKIYVQDLLKQDQAELWQLINEEDAVIYVCGDAKNMAKDVHRELISIVQCQGHRSEKEAQNFLHQLEINGRYQKDVWVT